VSFRLRVFALLTLVVVVTSTATAWLAWRQASRQVTESADARNADIETISRELTEYGWRHGTWEGVASLVQELGHRTDQRIRLVTEYGEVVVDTDTLAGQLARPVGSPPIPINPRPNLDLPEDEQDPSALTQITLAEIVAYRYGVRFAACLTRERMEVIATDGPYGVPRYQVAEYSGDMPTATRPEVTVSEAVEECQWFAREGASPSPIDQERVDRCVLPAPAPPGPERIEPTFPPAPLPSAQPVTVADLAVFRICLSQTFHRQVDDIAPLPLHLYVGAADDDRLALSITPILLAAALAAGLVLLGSMLISRRVLRPIGALTAASRRLADGDLSQRVPVVGSDELADLAQSFNQMADSLQRGEEQQRRLTADVAHELRTPLANLRGYLEGLRDGVLEPNRELFASLYEEAVLQQRIVDDLQELALAEAGTLVYHPTLIDAGELVTSCVAAHQAVADAAGVRLVAAAEQALIHVDPDRLRQALGNLISNAIRATAAGGSVTVSAQVDGGWAVLTVADTGSGIAPEHLPHLFDRFWRADPARGRATGGSGLGLAITRQIITDHHGQIAATSELGVGSVFTVRLPLAVGSDSPQPGH